VGRRGEGRETDRWSGKSREESCEEGMKRCGEHGADSVEMRWGTTGPKKPGGMIDDGREVSMREEFKEMDVRTVVWLKTKSETRRVG
jgi:hypothetical protein